MREVNRRFFLGSIAGMAFDAPLDPARLGIACSIGASEAAARKALSEARQAGFSRIQLQIPWSKVGDGFLKGVPGWLRAEGLQVEALGAYVNCCQPENVWMDCRREDFERAIQASLFLGAKQLVAWTGGYGADLMKSDPRNFTSAAEDSLCRFVDSYARRLEESGRRLALETYITLVCPDAPSLSRVLKRLPRCIGAVLDPPNLTPINSFAQRDGVLKEMFQLLKDRIGVVHLKDFRLDSKGTSYRLPGPMEGEMNYKFFFDLIRKLPSDTPLIAEHLSPDKFADARRRLLSLF